MVTFEKVLISYILLLCSVQVNADTLYIPKCSYSIWYDTKIGIPVKTEYHLTKGMLKSKHNRAEFTFYADQVVPAPRPKPSCYINSGYDRGHNVPAADIAYNILLMRETFAMTNISPMLPHFNRSEWKVVENIVRNLAETFGNVRIVTKPIFLYPDTLWLPCRHVAIPDAFRKTVYWYPNQKLLIDTIIWQRRKPQEESGTTTH